MAGDRGMTALEDFFAGRFDAWLATVSRPTPLWLFVHVPKTAGSSLAAEVAHFLQPYRSLHIDHLDRSRPAMIRYDAAVEEALAAHAAQPIRFASGHVQHRHVARLAAGIPGMRMFTMLREPSARLVSDYLYQRSPMHPLAEEVKSRVPDFDAFLDLKGQRNRTARHLVPKAIIDDGDAAAAIAHVERRFAFVGVQERYALGFRALAAMLGIRRAPTERKRVNSDAAAERAEIASRLADPALQARIAETNAIDLALFRHVASRWDAIAAPLEAWLEQRHPTPEA
jgi:hypothetical protein